MTTFGLKAGCGRLIEYDNADDLTTLYESGMLADVLPIGGGSNMLFVSPRYDGTVVHCRSARMEFSVPDAKGRVVCTAGAGVTLDDLCREACARGLWGIENLSGIPGEVGGASVQNVGAYGTEWKDVAVEIRCFDTATGRTISLSNADCSYGYRDSMFKHLDRTGSLIVYEAVVELSTLPKPVLSYAALQKAFGEADPQRLTPEMLRHEVISLRDAKLPSPVQTGSAGSFFKNPVISSDEFERMQAQSDAPIPGHRLDSGDVKLSAAWLIDKAGCKPLTRGGAALWPAQPLVIVNATGRATGADVVALEQAVINRVAERFGVTLHPEVIHIG